MWRTALQHDPVGCWRRSLREASCGPEYWLTTDNHLQNQSSSK